MWHTSFDKVIAGNFYPIWVKTKNSDYGFCSGGIFVSGTWYVESKDVEKFGWTVVAWYDIKSFREVKVKPKPAREKKHKELFPVGAMWVAKSTEIRRKCYIWLASRTKKGSERWQWKTVRTYDDESLIDSDWTTSLAKCKQDALIWNTSGKRIVYKRIK